MENEQIEAIIVEDHLSVRKGLELPLRREELRVAGVAGELEEARSLLSRRRYDVTLIDVQLGRQRSTGLVRELLQRDPDAAIVIYTGLSRHDDALEEAAHIGTRGFVLKSSPPVCLIEALRCVAAGGSYVDPALAESLSVDAELSRLDRLSPREGEILGLLADGLTGQESPIGSPSPRDRAHARAQRDQQARGDDPGAGGGAGCAWTLGRVPSLTERRSAGSPRPLSRRARARALPGLLLSASDTRIPANCSPPRWSRPHWSRRPRRHTPARGNCPS